MPRFPTPPANIQPILSALRSQIFHTEHNPAGARTGAKYLRRRLIGPSAIQYYPRTLKLATLNAAVPWNPYGGWRGETTPEYRATVVESASGGQVEKWSGTSIEEGAGGEGETQERKTRWANQGLMLPRSKAVEAGWTEVERIQGAGWVDDAKERTRKEEVGVRKMMGTGPPKKGEYRVSICRMEQELIIRTRKAVTDEEEMMDQHRARGLSGRCGLWSDFGCMASPQSYPYQSRSLTHNSAESCHEIEAAPSRQKPRAINPKFVTSNPNLAMPAATRMAAPTELCPRHSHPAPSSPAKNDSALLWVD